jgi:hypothetical protein
MYSINGVLDTHPVKMDKPENEILEKWRFRE